MNEKRKNIIELFEKLKRPLVLDGATGTLLIEKGIKPYRELWTTLANVEFPQLVEEVHSEYILNGAEIITTNTFNSNPVSLKLAGYKDKTTEELVETAVNIAKSAATKNNANVLIAGCNAPAEDCYQRERTVSKSELRDNHVKHIRALWNAGVDIIWNETHGHWDEIEIVCEYCETENLPYAINLYFEDDLKLLSGEPVAEAVEKISVNFPNAIIGFNCIAPSDFYDFVKSYFVEKQWGFYLNCGGEDKHNGEMVCAISPEMYVEYVSKIINQNTIYVGSCCGSNPEHTKAIKEFLIEKFNS